MKAKDLLKEIVKAYPDVVAIAQDKSNAVYVFYNFKPEAHNNEWNNFDSYSQFHFENIIEWDSENWKENIVTINDLKDEKSQ